MQAIAEALREAGLDDADLRFVGSRRGQEKNLLGGGPVELMLLPGRGLRRSLSASAWRDNVGAVTGLVIAFVRALGAVRRWRPRAVVSVGGYAAAAVSTAAVLWRRPLILVDLDATPGLTHRLLACFATVRCVTVGEPAARVVVTGAPVRRDVAAIDRSPDERSRAKRRVVPPIDPPRRVVVVMTGSLGAARVNAAVGDLARRWNERDDLTLVHVTGRRDYDAIAAQRPASGALDYRVIDFADMRTWWAVADLAICRAGALTVAELTCVALPAILIPLPGAPGDHQGYNARALAAAGAAVVVSDGACTGGELQQRAEALLAHDVLEEMSRASSRLARPDAAGAIAGIILARGEQP